MYKNLFIILFSITALVSCLKSEKKNNDKSSSEQISLSRTGYVNSDSPGFHADVLFFRDDNSIRPIKMGIKQIKHHTNFIFPTNGIIPGSEIRVSPRKITLIDLTNGKFIEFTGRLINKLLGIRYLKESFSINLKKHNKNKNISLYEVTVYDKIKTNRPLTKRMTLRVTFDKCKTVSPELLEFMMFPLGGRVPDVLKKSKDCPVLWKWTWYDEEHTGSASWQILNFSEKTFGNKDFGAINSKLIRTRWKKFFASYVSFSKNPFAYSLGLKNIIGLLYINQKVVSIIPPHGIIYVSPAGSSQPVLNKIQIYPLFNGPALLNKDLKPPVKWIIK